MATVRVQKRLAGQIDGADQFFVTAKREPVGHAGDEIADRAQPLNRHRRRAAMPAGSRAGLFVGGRQVADDALGLRRTGCSSGRP